MKLPSQKSNAARETRENPRKTDASGQSVWLSCFRDDPRVLRAFQFFFAFAGFVVMGIGFGTLNAQSPDEPNEGSVLEVDTANLIYRFKWWGAAGRTYFIQHSDNLAAWNWLPHIETGTNSVHEQVFPLDGDKFFVRLCYSDILTTDPQGADFDSDGLNNMEELLIGTHPLKADSDGDQLSDGWETTHGLDPLDPDQNQNSRSDADEDFDGDGFTNTEEFLANLDPLDPLNGLPPSAAPPTGPGMPTIEESTSGNVVEWEDRSTNEHLFFVERSTGLGVWEKIGTVPANSTEFVDSAAAPGRVYFYRVVSRNAVPE